MNVATVQGADSHLGSSIAVPLQSIAQGGKEMVMHLQESRFKFVISLQ